MRAPAAAEACDGEGGLGDVLAAVAASSAAHLTGPLSEAELERFEEGLGLRLPAPLRTFLVEVGHGLFAGRHEILGPHSLVLHDIEFVPSMQSVGARLGLPRGLLAVHREGPRVHAIDLRPSGQGDVLEVGGTERWPDTLAFLRSLFVP